MLLPLCCYVVTSAFGVVARSLVTAHSSRSLDIASYASMFNTKVLRSASAGCVQA